MYKIECLPIAKSDMEEIIYYISQELKNTKAALELINEFRKQEKYINIYICLICLSNYKTVKA